MADSDHTLESLSTLENSPLIIKLTVSEIFVAAPKDIGCIALSVLAGEHEPSILLQGEWVRAMGFEKGQSIQIVAMSNLLAVERIDETVKPSDKAEFNKDRFVLFKNFKDELDAIKAGYADMVEGEGRDLNGVMYGGHKGSDKGNESANKCGKGRKIGSKFERRARRNNECKSEDGREDREDGGEKEREDISEEKSQVQAEADCGDSRG